MRRLLGHLTCAHAVSTLCERIHRAGLRASSRKRYVVALPAVAALSLLAFGASAQAATLDGAYVTNFSDNTVRTAGATISVGGGPAGVAITPDGKTAYVTSQSANTVTPVDTATNTAGAAIGVGGSTPRAIAITPDGETAYVVSAIGGVTPIDTATNTPEPIISNGSVLGGIAITPDGETAYLTIRNSRLVLTIATATNTVVDGISQVGDTPGAIAITPDGETAYMVVERDDTVTPIDTATNTIGTPIAVGDEPTAVAITPDGATAYAVNETGDTVTPIDIATNTAGAAIGVGDNPNGIAVTPDGETALVTNGNDDTVTPIDIATNTTEATIGVGDFPTAVAVMPNQGPTASFTDTFASPGSPSTFDASGSSDSDGTIASYNWDFGDGTTETTTSPTTTHTYAAVDDYTITLTVTDDIGCSTTQTFTGQTVGCNGGPRATISHTRVPPDTTITDSPPAVTNDPATSFDFESDLTESTFECSFVTQGTAPAFSSCTSPYTPSGALSDDSYTFSVRASKNGQVDLTPDSSSFELDTALPEVTISGRDKTKDRTPTFTLTYSEDVDEVLCKVDARAFRDCSSPYTTSRLRRGRHTLYVEAVDAAGNRTSPAAEKRFRIVR